MTNLQEHYQYALSQLQSEAISLARNNQQVVGNKNEYYITLQQLDSLSQELLK